MMTKDIIVMGTSARFVRFRCLSNSRLCVLLRRRDSNPTVAPDFMSPDRLSNLTIVVVDDHHEIRRYVGAYLYHLGAHVVVAENAFEGLEAVRTYRPNLVLSDISLPGRDGFGLLLDIRALGPDTGGNVPVIAMTALVGHVDRRRVLNAGFQAYLPKPFTPDGLLETILAVLRP